MSETKEESVARVARRGVAVPASPFNPVKLEMALLMLGGLMVWWVLEQWPLPRGVQLGLAAGYGLIGLAWVIFRTRRILTQVSTRAMAARHE